MKEFLESIGKLVVKADEVKVGDIVAAANQWDEHNVRLYCVKKITLDPQPPWLSPRMPHIDLKAPHIGINFAGSGNICRHYLHTPMPGQPYQDFWVQISTPEDYKEYKEFCETILEEDIKHFSFPLYLVNHGNYIKLGNLINDVETPNWSVLFQTVNGEQEIYDYANAVKAKFAEAKEIYKFVKERSGCY